MLTKAWHLPPRRDKLEAVAGDLVELIEGFLSLGLEPLARSSSGLAMSEAHRDQVQIRQAAVGQEVKGLENGAGHRMLR